MAPMKLNLTDLGWNDFFAKHFEPYREQGWKSVDEVLQAEGGES